MQNEGSLRSDCIRVRFVLTCTNMPPNKKCFLLWEMSAELTEGIIMLSSPTILLLHLFCCYYLVSEVNYVLVFNGT